MNLRGIVAIAAIKIQIAAAAAAAINSWRPWRLSKFKSKI
jgi:hypothetical protein